MKPTFYPDNGPAVCTDSLKIQYLSQEDWSRLLQDKKNFVFHCSDNPYYCYEMYPQVATSWIKSRELGVNIERQVLHNPLLSAEELDEIIKENRLLIDFVKPFYGALKQIMFSYNYASGIFDKNGVLLLTEGTRPGPASGTVWTEEYVGTNIVSLCRQCKMPLLLPGCLCYSDVFAEFFSAACPILNNQNEIMGILALYQPLTEELWEEDYQQKGLQALRLVSEIAAAVESGINLTQNYNNVVFNELKVTLDLNDRGMITIDQTGRITSINQVASQMLRLGADQIVGGNITDLLSKQSRLMDTVRQGKNADLQETIGRNGQSYLVNVRSIINEYTDHIDGAVLKISSIEKNILLKSGFSARFTFDELTGQSQGMLKAVELAKRYADTPENILLIGESGTGKELFAQAIHNQAKPSGPFVAVNCAAVPSSLIESELFGYEGGSFTGAERTGRVGKIELASEGTLFLDEIGDMPYELQAVLLRVLEDKRIMRIGGRSYRQINFRLIAATNKDLYQMVKDGKFREDLYFRLSVLPIDLPPLRQRGSDIELLTSCFIEKYCLKQNKPALQISNATMRVINGYSWPGNVRQLENAVICAINTEKSDTIQPESLPAYITSDMTPQNNESEEIYNKLEKDLSLRNWEKFIIERALTASNNYIPMAADLLGIGKSTLYRKLKEYNLDS